MVPDRGPDTLAATVVVTVIATIFVAARFYTRIWLIGSIKQDDWWIFAAWIVAVAFSTSICVGVKYGLGKHKVDIPDDDFVSLRKAEYAFSILYNPAIMLTKTSIVSFFLHVMSRDVDPVFKWCNWLTLLLVNAVGTALTFYNIFQCRPVAAGYQYPTPAGAKCSDIFNLYLSSAPVNIITDIAILILPMPILTKMRLPRKQKIILVLTFSAGVFVAVVDVIRIAYLQDAALDRLKVVKSNGQSTRIVEENDFSWYASPSFMWSAVEVCIGISCACVPSLKPLFLRFMPLLIKDEGDSQTQNGSVDLTRTNQSAISNLPKGNVSMLNHPAAFHKPSTPEYCGEDDGDQMGFLNMLAKTPSNDMLGLERTSTRRSRRSVAKTTASDFKFVNMSKRNMLKLSNKQSIWPNAVVTVIFFLWGFAYGLLDTLNSRFEQVAKLSSAQGLGLHAAYYGGYLIGPLTLGRFILKRYGFKASMIAGLFVYGCGTLVFWPSAVLTSYGAFLVSNLIVGYGLSCLEIAANPYIALCGPLEYAEVRLNLAQAFQAIGTVCSPLLATKVLFKNVLDAPSLIDVQWTYLGIALFDFALAVIFYYIPLPEATEEQLDEQADRRSAAYSATVGPWKVTYVTLGIGVFSQFCYVGLQECVGNNIEPLISLVKPHSGLEPFTYQTLGHTVFMAGRFLTALLNFLFKPRSVLLVLYVGLVVCLALQMHLSADGGAVVALLTFFVEAGIFANTFASSMRGLGVHTKTGSALMTSAISGGGVFPPIAWAVSKGHGLKYSYCVPLAGAVFGMFFPIYLALVPAAKVQVDPVHDRRMDSRLPDFSDQPGTNSSLESRAQQYGVAGMIARRKNRKEGNGDSAHATTEHLEKPVRKGRSSRSGLPVFVVDFADDKIREISPAPESPTAAPVDSRPAKGYVAALALWPQGEGEAGSHAGTSNFDNAARDDADIAIGQRRPVWEGGGEADEDPDDYHAIVRKI
ncbi:MFS transporter [Exophiala viscosa]|uniref:MFS transporter n=1 Tax=Exophiala viscosa TaxID=2486360 RepID=A0AAN6E375_9EURO|nr:MFS transporter [Exophiala viscosa]KAI1630181.1 MFS transporter [Exophiala viscosa]